jgi:hypothetical protein
MGENSSIFELAPLIHFESVWQQAHVVDAVFVNEPVDTS